MEPEGSLHVTSPTTCPCAQLDEYSPLPPHPKLYFHISLPFMCHSFNTVFPSGSPPELCKHFSYPHACRISLPLICSLEYIWWGLKTMMLLITQFSPVSCHFLNHRPKYFPQHSILNHPQPVLSQTNFCTHTRQAKTQSLLTDNK